MARGRLSGWYQTAGHDRPETNLSAEVEIEFDEPRYCLQLLHAATPPSGSERLEIVLFDGHTLYSLTATQGTCKGGVFFEFSQAAVLRAAGFPFSVLLRYWDDALNLKEIDPRVLNRIGLGQSGAMLVEDRKTYLRQIYLDESSSYGLHRVALRHPNSTAPFREHWLHWAHDQNLAYVRHYGVRQRYAIKDPPPGQVVSRQHEIEIDHLEVRDRVEPGTFSLQRLGIPPGTPFSDYRATSAARDCNWCGMEPNCSPPNSRRMLDRKSC